MNKAIIFDMDGCICHCDPMLRLDWNDHNACNRIMANNKPNMPLVQLTRWLPAQVDVLIVTGRPELYRPITVRWLVAWDVRCRQLWMRPAQLMDLSDAEVKRDILRDIRRSYEVQFAIEDRESVVAMWREERVLCLQCAEGKY